MKYVKASLAVVAVALLIPSASRADDAADSKEPAKQTEAGKDGKKGKALEKALAKFDKNHDGALDKDELTAMLAAREKKAEEAGKVAGKHPKLTAAELIKKFDTNDDGKLDAKELAKMGEELHAKGKKKEKKAAA